MCVYCVCVCHLFGSAMIKCLNYNRWFAFMVLLCCCKRSGWMCLYASVCFVCVTPGSDTWDEQAWDADWSVPHFLGYSTCSAAAFQSSSHLQPLLLLRHMQPQPQRPWRPASDAGDTAMSYTVVLLIRFTNRGLEDRSLVSLLGVIPVYCIRHALNCLFRNTFHASASTAVLVWTQTMYLHYACIQLLSVNCNLLTICWYFIL